MRRFIGDTCGCACYGNPMSAERTGIAAPIAASIACGTALFGCAARLPVVGSVGVGRR